ncbi:arginyl-tRNA--protein transferase 1 [Elysia marginata]|uniref:Arginyl-tRNA--protein transferase 1 n=1 Tax=Elysia marginata TaxID=1093978 RepID=A0AAV4GPI1_9GAST|nr:arginyl-tRNA--protein transferase 1 [Elysia marginata]
MTKLYELFQVIIMEGPHSIVEYFAEHDRYRCGYCGQKDTNYSHVMWAHQMSVQDYQDLIDRGWRRSGKTVYKPTMNVMCCPHYTIRCRALDFKLSKSHKKQIKRVNRYLIHGIKPGKEEDQEEDEASKTKKTSKNDESQDSVNQTQSQVPPAERASSSGSRQEGNKTPVKNTPKPGSGADPNKPKCRKAKEIRAERKAMKMSVGDKIAPKKEPKPNTEKSLEELLTEPDQAENPAHKLELRLVRSSPRSEAFKQSFDASHGVYKHYQMSVHKDPPSKPNKGQFTRFLCDSPLAIKLCRSAPVSQAFRQSFKASYGVYRKYQMSVHKDKPQDCDIRGYQGFLVDSPLQEQHGANVPSQGYGSFHQQYWLDGNIIAVGVVDILPTCLSSVYLYYDPDYSFLGLGVYSALREIMFVRELQRSATALQYYYMGFYIHSCPKMKYKAQFHPSDLVCPESYQWVPMPQCLPKLDASPYARLSEPGAEDKNKDIDVNQVLVLNSRKVLPYALYKMLNTDASDEESVKEYAGFVGKTCAERMFLVRQ